MKRYLLQQPKALQCLTIVKIGDWVTLQAITLMLPIPELHQRDSVKAEALLSQQMEIIRNHLDLYVPKMFHDRVVAETIQALKKIGRWPLETKSVDQMNVIMRVIETLFSKNLTFLSLTCNTFLMFRNSFCSKSYLLTSLAHLELNAKFLETEIILFLKELHSLIYLSIANCSHDILRCVVENCKLIEELDLCGESSIHNGSMYLLTQLQKLRIFKLRVDGPTLVGRNGIGTLLISCNNIEHISLRIPDILMWTLKRIQKAKGERRFNLRAISCNIYMLQLAVKMCPLIQNLSLYNERNLPSDLKLLTYLQNLRELRLSGFNFYNQFKEPLQIIGCNLVHLHLDCVNQLDLNAIIDISQICPNLQSLSIDICFPNEAVSLDRTLEIPPFRNLKDLILKSSTSTRPPRITVPAFSEQIFFLLSNCLNVEFVSIGCSVQLTEDTISNILKTNSLDCLKRLSLWHYHYKVATMVIDHIIQNGIVCPEVIQFKQIF